MPIKLVLTLPPLSFNGKEDAESSLKICTMEWMSILIEREQEELILQNNAFKNASHPLDVCNLNLVIKMMEQDYIAIFSSRDAPNHKLIDITFIHAPHQME